MHLPDLPPEVLLSILRHLPPADRKQAACACQLLRMEVRRSWSLVEVNLSPRSSGRTPLPSLDRYPGLQSVRVSWGFLNDAAPIHDLVRPLRQLLEGTTQPVSLVFKNPLVSLGQRSDVYPAPITIRDVSVDALLRSAHVKDVVSEVVLAQPITLTGCLCDKLRSVTLQVNAGDAVACHASAAVPRMCIASHSNIGKLTIAELPPDVHGL